MTEKTVRIEGMSCHHCVMALRKSFQMIDGVEDADVSAGTARIRFVEKKVSDKDIENAVTRAGFKLRDY